MKAYLLYVYDFTTVAGKRADATKKKRSKNKLLTADLDDMVNQQIKSQKVGPVLFLNLHPLLSLSSWTRL